VVQICRCVAGSGVASLLAGAIEWDTDLPDSAGKQVHAGLSTNSKSW